MKCTDKTRRKRVNRKKQLHIRIICTVLFMIAIIAVIFIITGSRNRVRTYESLIHSLSVYKASLFADDLCVANKDVEFEAFRTNDEFHGALLFDLANQETIYSERANERLYPASTTKIMTSYLALKYGDLKEYVTVSSNATKVPADSSTAHLQKGDVLTLEDLLYSLMLPSGNDSAVAIAEHISGSVEEFVELMNIEAAALGATNTHFVNSHGYHHKDHYTTAYDLYLIFNECIKNETFLKLISSSAHETIITQADGSTRTALWQQSNQFINGSRKVPKNMTLVGGKTGNTFDAGSCILLYGHDSESTPYIAVMMGATSKRNLYDNMTFLLAAIE